MIYNKAKLFVLLIIAVATQNVSAQIKIGGTPGTGDPSSVLELQSTGNNQGFLPPRLTTAQRNAIATPAVGLTVFNTDEQCLDIYKGSTNGWYNMCSGGGGFSFTNCSTPTVAGTFTASTSASGATITLNYVNNTGQVSGLFASTPTSGITLAAPGGTVTPLVSGSGTIVLIASGIPTAAGNITIPINLAGISCSIPITVGAFQGNVPVSCGIAPGCTGGISDPSTAVAGSKICWGGYTYNAITVGSRLWLDRNLGAQRVPTSETDVAGMGDLYQWGRTGDGHQCTIYSNAGSMNGGSGANSPTISGAQAPTVNITGTYVLNGTNWLNPVNDTLWTGNYFGGSGNPCPVGWRVPTIAEITGALPNGTQPFTGSTLKVPCIAGRSPGPAVGWDYTCALRSSTPNGNSSYILQWSPGGNVTGSNQNAPQASGWSVRCIKSN